MTSYTDLLASLIGHSYFHSDTKTFFAFVTVDSGTDSKEMMDKTADSLAQIKQ